MTLEPMPDERGNLPSASSFERLALCEGSFQLEQLAPAEQGEPDVAALSGTRIHAALNNELGADALTDEELSMTQRCDRLANAVAEKTYGRLEDATTLLREKRLWYFDAEGRPLFSGKPDLVAIYGGSRALIIDYKTGRGAVTAAHSNLQLRALVALVTNLAFIKEATVAIVQPNGDQPLTTATYTGDDIIAARDEVEAIIRDSRKPDAKRTPSEAACKYCRAKSICPEARDAVQQLPVPIPQFMKPAEAALALTDDKLALFLDHASFAEKIIEACRDEAKRRIEAGKTINGWSLKEGTTRETITDPQKVFDRYCAVGGKPEDFMGCVSVTKGKLKTAVKAATATKGKELDQTMDSILAGCVESKQSSPSLIRV